MKKLIWLFIAGFFIYMSIEVIFGASMGAMIGYQGRTYLSLSGYTSVWMGVIGGFLLIVLGFLNTISFIKNRSLFIQSLLGAIIITLIEFVSGCILNLWFGLHIWSYEGVPLNILGQIDLIFFVFWFFLAPLAFWADDLLRWVFYKTGICSEANSAYNLLWFYKQLFTFKKIDYPVEYLLKIFGRRELSL